MSQFGSAMNRLAASISISKAKGFFATSSRAESKADCYACLRFEPDLPSQTYDRIENGACGTRKVCVCVQGRRPGERAIPSDKLHSVGFELDIAGVAAT
jgi:hypothetical protein